MSNHYEAGTGISAPFRQERSQSDKRPEKHRTEFAHWQHRIEHFKDHLAQGHTREALHAFHDLGHDDSHKLARDLGLHDDGPEFADKKTLMGAIHGRLLAKKHELQAQVGRQVKADFEKRKAAGTVGKKVTRVQFVQAPDGGTDFGAVPSLHSKLIADKSYPAAPIRMEEGGAFGGQHLAPSRLREFHDYGYASPAAVLDDVAKHFTQIFEQPNGRLLLVKRNGRAKFAAVELQPQAADQYYGVTTLFLEDVHPRGKPYEARGGRKLLWPVAQAAHSGSDTPFPAVANPAGATVAGARESNLSVGQGAGQSKAKDAVTMSKQELIAEHEKLVAVLKSPDHGDDLKEAKKQEKELKEYKQGPVVVFKKPTPALASSADGATLGSNRGGVPHAPAAGVKPMTNTNFNKITAEGIDYGVTFWERADRQNHVNGYTVERTKDGVKASMLHSEGRIWRGAFGGEHMEGTKAAVANWALDKVANADKQSGAVVITTPERRKVLAAAMPGLRHMSTQWRNVGMARTSDASALILKLATEYRDVAAKLGLMNFSTELSARIGKHAQTQDPRLLGEMNNLMSGLDNILVIEHLLDAYKKS